MTETELMHGPERHPSAQSLHSKAVAALNVGQTYTIPGITACKAHTYIARAKRGTSKWFEARTLTTGACIRRVE